MDYRDRGLCRDVVLYTDDYLEPEVVKEWSDVLCRMGA